MAFGLSAANGGGGANPEIRYEVVASSDASDLIVMADVPPGAGTSFTVDRDARPFVAGMSRADADRWLPVPVTGAGWRVAECVRSGCRLRYTFHLAAAARALDEPDVAAGRGAALVAPASTWLIRPAPLPGGARGRLHVAAPPPIAFVTGLPPVSGTVDTYSLELLPFFLSPYSAFGRFDVEKLTIGGADLELAVSSPALSADRARIRAWVTAAARAMVAYFGRFPVDRALLLAVPQPTGVHGKALGGGGASVLLQMAPGVSLDDPGIDWQAAHEMVHLAVPEMSRAQLWLTEGLATYVEPIARSITGELPPEIVWRDLVGGLPKGLPGPDDQGLDHTHTWGRTYWGGALFAFVADLEIRKASNGRESLATALRGTLRAGGDARVFWPVERFMTAADQSLGSPQLMDLYRRMADRPVEIDLPAIWRDLGVAVDDEGRVTFDDRAPLASLRRRMVGRGASPPEH